MTNVNIAHTVLERKNATQTMLIGIYSGLVALFVCLIGMVETFGERDIIGGIISMGHTMLIVIAMGGGALAVNKLREDISTPAAKSNKSSFWIEILVGITSGLIVGATLSVFVFATAIVDMRSVLGAAIFNITPRIRLPLVVGLASVVSLGMLRDMVKIILSREGWPSVLLNFLVKNQGLSITGAITIFATIVVLVIIWPYFPAIYDKIIRVVVTYVPRALQLTVSIIFAITLAMRIFWFIAISDKDLPVLPTCNAAAHSSDVGEVGLVKCINIALPLLGIFFV